MENKKINFPVFLEGDINSIERHVKDVARKIGDRIIELEETLLHRLNYISCLDEYGKKRILYHLICDFTFDGAALEYLSDRDMFSVYKEQPGDRNNILIGYENNKNTLKYNDELLCSSQNYSVGRFKFNSFGDCDGERIDFHRFFKNVSQCLGTESNNKELMSSYIKLNDIYNKNTVKKCGELIVLILEDEIYVEDLSGEERYMIDIMKEIGYINIDDDNRIVCTVPVIKEKDIEIFRDISYVILENIYEEIDKACNSIKEELKDIIAIKQEVSIKEVCNEIWNQIFGFTNEYLIEKEFIAEPKYRINEGRYFQCIYIYN